MKNKTLKLAEAWIGSSHDFFFHSTETLIHRVKFSETFKSSNGKQKLIKLFFLFSAVI